MALVVLMFLLHGRSALVPMVTLPLVVLLTFAAMRLFGIPATVMSLGGIAIALGMAVDAELVALEACHRRLETIADGGSRARRRGGAALVAAAGAFAPAILTSLLIAALAFVPGVRVRRRDRPAAAPAGAHARRWSCSLAALVTLTVAPALRDRLLRGRIVPELGNPLTRVLVRAYRPFVHFALLAPGAHAGDRRRWRRCRACRSFRVWAASSCRASTRAICSTCPRRRRASAHDDAPCELAAQDRDIAEHPGRRRRVRQDRPRRDARPIRRRCRWRRRRSGSSPAPSGRRCAHARWYSSWAPRAAQARCCGSSGPRATPMTTAELIDSLDKTTRVPGWTNAWTAPVRARMDMMATGVRTPVGHPRRRRRLRRGWTRSARAVRGRRARACPARAAPCTRGWAARRRLELRAGSRRRSRATTSTRRRRARSPTWCWRAATWASCAPRTDAASAAARPLPVRLSLDAPRGS